jgi:hypothetical protein
MASIKHSKYRNSGILFELLVRQTTADLVANKDSKAVKILKKYFSNTELGREYALYNNIVTSPKLSETKANMLITTVLEQYAKLNKEAIQKLKFNLIREIKANYEINEFFKAKVDNYKTYASIFSIFESQIQKNIDAKQIFLNKVVILEHVTKSKIEDMQASKSIVEDLMKEDKEIRLLTYKILVEKFNDKYQGLSERQKHVLKTYITSVSDTTKLNSFVNTQLQEIKTDLQKLSAKIPDQVMKIKLDEVVKLVTPIKEGSRIKDETISGLLQYIDLIEELKKSQK